MRTIVSNDCLKWSNKKIEVLELALEPKVIERNPHGLFYDNPLFPPLQVDGALRVPLKLVTAGLFGSCFYLALFKQIQPIR